nr:E3 ubiquitin-protein ligase RHA1B-like [Ipomoea batatas]
MGFPVIYTDVFVPSVVVQTLSILCYLRTIFFSVFASLGLTEAESPEPEVYFHESSAGIGNQSAASMLIRELLAVAKFSEVGGGEESCAVCLCEYESGDEIRRLRNCSHIFHRRCLDRWIDNGRNTCPLCRASLVPRELQEEFEKRLRAVSVISRDLSTQFNSVEDNLALGDLGKEVVVDNHIPVQMEEVVVGNHTPVQVLGQTVVGSHTPLLVVVEVLGNHIPAGVVGKPFVVVEVTDQILLVEE